MLILFKSDEGMDKKIVPLDFVINSNHSKIHAFQTEAVTVKNSIYYKVTWAFIVIELETMKSFSQFFKTEENAVENIKDKLQKFGFDEKDYSSIVEELVFNQDE